MAANRTTRVSLVAEVSSYVAGMERAARSTRQTGDAAQQLAQRREGIDTLGKTMFAAGAVMAAGVGLAVAKFAEFDQAMSAIQAATHETEANMGLLRQAAIDAGGATAFSATEAAGAIEELAKAGLSTAEILSGGLAGALDLAAAGGQSVADAAQTTAIAMKQFGLEGDKASHVADLLAAGAGKAVGDVSDMAAALGQAGLVANQTGLSIEETTGVLAAFADQGLLGSDAGTSLKTALQALTPSSKEAAREMERLGISAFDAQGNFIGISEFAGVYQNALRDLSPEQQAATSKIIFGSDAVRAANVLYTNGAQGIQKYIDQTNDSGYAAETARIKMDNLAGDIEKLGGAFDTALIQGGSGANDVLREVTQGVTFLVDAVGGAPQPVLNAGLAIATVGAAVGIVGGGALLAVPKVIAFKASLDTLGISAGRAAAATVAIGGAIGLAAVAVGTLVGQQAKVAATTAELADTLDEATGATTQYTRASIARKLSDEGIFDTAKKAGVGQKELTDAILEGGDALEEVQLKIGDLNTAGNVFNGLALKSDLAGRSIQDLRQSVENAPTKFEDLKKAGDEAGEGMANTADGLSQVQAASADAGAEIDDLKATIEGFGSAQLDVNSATRDFEAAVDGLTDSVKENGQSLDVTTAAGRENEAALDQIAQSALGLSSATLAQTGSQEKASAALSVGRKKLIEALGALGITGQAAEDYADRLGLIPSNIATAVNLSGAQNAIDKAYQVASAIRNIPGQRDIVINQVVRETDAARGVVGAAYAAGGAVQGPGPVGRDSVVAMLAPGEHVLTDKDVSRLGGQSGVYAMRASLAAGTFPRYAKGGPVGIKHYTYGQAAAYSAATAPAPQINVSIQSKGGIDLLKYVDVRIDRADQAASLSNRMGRQVR
ncbi:TP901 family phage tail tape measure protein [Frigoribacterium sp. PhB160]|uniref:phage tail tape measure protein n=1 Tax=Frigoribacterium sp. PhB160 TaxID=2485192 RepID=UPI000F46971F|nr:phage tail tape measure protein [Frigoribacterium sp. PhB160]ROS61074.1 TP901 family phage tail tape measure protein [Frigoribacterium sp. PhB160]